MSKLKEYAAKSDIMKMKVKYNNDTFTWDLNEELKIIETKLNTQVKGHTVNYAFLAMLHVKLKIKYRDQQKHVKRLKDSYMVDFKGKFKTVTEAEAQMYAQHPKLKLEEDKLIHIEELRDLLEVNVKAFEQRKDMLQSLSANLRREQNTQS